MPIPKKLIKFLDKTKVKYETIEHKTVYTALDKAKTLEIPQKIVGKTLVIKMNRDFALALTPANKILDKRKFKKVLNNFRKRIGQKPVKTIDFATEAWMKKNLIGVKVGAVPPLGGLWKLPAFIEGSLIKEKEIFLNGGNYNVSIKINPKEIKKLNLITGNFSKAKK